jgi:hypothetical protein
MPSSTSQPSRWERRSAADVRHLKQSRLASNSLAMEAHMNAYHILTVAALSLSGQAFASGLDGFKSGYVLGAVRTCQVEQGRANPKLDARMVTTWCACNARLLVEFASSAQLDEASKGASYLIKPIQDRTAAICTDIVMGGVAR